MYWGPPPSAQHSVIHLDSDTTNWDPLNLEWVSPQEKAHFELAKRVKGIDAATGEEVVYPSISSAAAAAGCDRKDMRTIIAGTSRLFIFFGKANTQEAGSYLMPCTRSVCLPDPGLSVQKGESGEGQRGSRCLLRTG